MTPKPMWVDGRVDALLAALHDLGMSVSRAAAADSSPNASSGCPRNCVSPPPRRAATSLMTP